MKQLSLNELPADAGRWVRQAALERQIVITDQGQPVAALTSFRSTQGGKPLPNREERVTGRSYIAIDSATYISEMRD